VVLTPGSRPQWDIYEDLLLMAMGVERLATAGQVFRGLFMPSFHRDVCLTVRVRPDGGEVEPVALDPLGRTEIMELIGVRFGSERRPGRSREPTPPPWRTRAAISPERAARFAHEMSALDREALSASTSCGLDGIRLRGEIADAGPVFQFSAWSPAPSSSPAQHGFFAGLYRLAAELIEDACARLALENLHGYLDLGLPVVDLGGVPRRLRLFGRLSADDTAELKTLFQSLRGEEALIMDLGNFENMGAAFYPLFRELAGRPGPTTWCASAPAHAQLVAAGVDTRTIFDRIEDALAACSTAAMPPR
jgi:hypothetical protein